MAPFVFPKNVFYTWNTVNMFSKELNLDVLAGWSNSMTGLE